MALGALVAGVSPIVDRSIELDELSTWLVANGYKRAEAVEYPGEFGRRGGICDVFGRRKMQDSGKIEAASDSGNLSPDLLAHCRVISQDIPQNRGGNHGWDG